MRLFQAPPRHRSRQPPSLPASQLTVCTSRLTWLRTNPGEFCVRFGCVRMGHISKTEKSILWTDTGVDQNFHGELGAIGPYMNSRGNVCGPILCCLVFGENLYGPMALNFAKSFPQDWYWSMDGSSQQKCSRSFRGIFRGGFRSKFPSGYFQGFPQPQVNRGGNL